MTIAEDYFLEEDRKEGYPRKLFGHPLGCPSSEMDFIRLGKGWLVRKLGVKKENPHHRPRRSMHRKQSGKKFTHPRVEFKRIDPQTGKQQSIVIQLKEYGEHWLQAAVNKAGLAPEKPKFNLKIRQNGAFDARLLEIRHGYKYYSRTLVGKHWDYVIESPTGIVYRHAAKKHLLRGST